MKNPLISIIVPIYNVEKYLCDCIDSVVKQTYENLEILLINDGSLDDCGKICERYAEIDTRIKVIHKENGGLSDARNVGLENYKGEFLFFLDSDDVLENDAIEYLYSLILDNNADMSVCQRSLISENGTRLEETKKHSSFVLYGQEAGLKALLKHKINDSACMKLYKRNCFENIRFPRAKYSEDLFVAHLAVAACNVIAVGNEGKYLYRIRENSILHRNFEERHLDVIEGAVQRLQFISLHYSKLSKYAKSGIISACNLCAFIMIRSKQDKKEMKKYMLLLQSYYRKYAGSFLFSNGNSFSSKLFCLASFLSVAFSIKIASKILKDR